MLQVTFLGQARITGFARIRRYMRWQRRTMKSNSFSYVRISEPNGTRVEWETDRFLLLLLEMFDVYGFIRTGTIREVCERVMKIGNFYCEF